MTTDIRTNEPTEAQIEAAAKALEKLPLNLITRGEALDAARAALVAAQGAAPQAGAYDHCCNHPKCPGGSLCCCISEQRQRDCWNQWREEVAGDTKQAFRDAYSAGRNDPAPWAAAPVPSSGVDEEKLAEVLSQHVLGEPNGGTASWAWLNCSCSHRIEVAGVTREHVVALGRKHQARAVAEWLKEQRR